MKLPRIILTVLLMGSMQLVAQELPVVIPEAVNLNTVQLLHIDRVVNEAIEKEEIPGAVVAIVRDNQIGYLKAFGYKQTYPYKENMSINTIFDLASCTKPLATAISTFILVERGYLSLQDPISIYLPEFGSWKDEDEEVLITINDLLAHTSGLPAYAPVSKLKENPLLPLPEVLKEYIAHCDLTYKPRSDMKYSCLNYITLQHIIETISGQTLSQFTKDNIYQPLKLKDTGFLPNDNLLARIAPTQVINDSILLQGVVHDPLARELNFGNSGNAGLFSSAKDVAVLVNLFLNEGRSIETRILSPASIQKMSSLPFSFESFGRGLGWDISSPFANNQGDLLNGDTFGHTGYTGTSIVIDPKSKLGLIILTNSVHPYDQGKVVRLRRIIANIVAASIDTANNQGYLEHYSKRMKEFNVNDKITSKSIVMLGDSQTENGGDWGKLLGKKNVINRGIIGDNTNGVINRLDEIIEGAPKQVVLTIGINDISQGLNNESLIENVNQIIERIQKESPKTTIHLQSVLPINEKKSWYRLMRGKKDIIIEYNTMLEELALSKGITFINSYPIFTTESDNQLREELTNDGLHLNQYGYKLWSNFLKEYIK